MAVKIPNPPTPPTPPSVPGVTLSEGGTVKESNAPPASGTTSKSTDNEKQMEEQARAAVAQGSGTLSRTTQTDPAAEAKAAREAAKAARQSGENQAQSAAETGRSQAAQGALLGSEAASQERGQGAPGQERAAAALQAEPPPKSFDYQGIAYWVPMLLLGFVIGSLLLKRFLHRQGRKGELTKSDLDRDALGAAESRELRGLTPDEVLERLAAREREASKPAAAQVAKAKIRQTYAQETEPKSQVKKNSPSMQRAKTKADSRQGGQEEERKPFEVRI